LTLITLGNHGLGRMISIDINYSWKLQLEIMHWDCPKGVLGSMGLNLI
jgi:hypothetical protein